MIHGWVSAEQKADHHRCSENICSCRGSVVVETHVDLQLAAKTHVALPAARLSKPLEPPVFKKTRQAFWRNGDDHDNDENGDKKDDDVDDNLDEENEPSFSKLSNIKHCFRGIAQLIKNRFLDV